MEYPKEFVVIPGQCDQHRAFNACCSGDSKSLEGILLEQDTHQRNAANIITSMSFLAHAAAANNSVECLEVLQRYQADLDDGFKTDDPSDREPRTPLREAVRHGHYPVVKFLREQGAQVNVCMFADMYKFGNKLDGERLNILEFLLHELITAPNHEEDDLESTEDLHPCLEVWQQAIYNDRPEVGTRLFAHIREIHPDALIAAHLSEIVDSRPRSDVMFELLLQEPDIPGWGDDSGADECIRALRPCALNCQVPFARKLLAIGDTGNSTRFGDFYKRIILTQTLIHAVEANCSELITLFIDRGVSPNAFSWQNHTAIYQAVCSEKPTLATLQQLLKSGADPNLRSVGCDWTMGDPEYKLSNEATFPSDIEEGNTTLHALAESVVRCSNVLVERAKKLLEAGANVNAINERGFTPLDVVERYHFKAHSRSPAANEALADILRSAGGQTRLHDASSNTDRDQQEKVE